ncbi:MAG: hypothetical protein ACYDEX_18730, partial [Mobilitalea sp.]
VNRGTNVFIQLNEQDTLISILRDDILILQRTVGYGISTLTDAVMEQEHYQINDRKEALELLESKNLLSLEIEQEDPIQFDSSWSKGEAAAASEVVLATGLAKTQDKEMEQEARRYIIDSLHFLTNSIARMLDYYKSNHKDIEINTIYLSGTGVRIQGIDQFFFSEIGMTHKKMEKLWTISAKKKASAYRKNPSEFISCIGAVIKPIDFVPLEFVEKKQKRSAIIATVIFALACLAGAIGTTYVSYTDYLIAEQELDAVNQQLEELPQISLVYNEYDVAVKELEDLKLFEAMTQSKNDKIIAVIDELEKKLPSDTVILSMQFTESGITMNCTASDNNVGANALIAKLYKQLEEIEYFATVDVTGNPVDGDGITSKVNFSITCTYAQ